VTREGKLQPAVLSEQGGQLTAEQVEKRRHSRITVSVSAEIIEPQTRARVTGRVTDLGVGGCYVDTMNTFAQGAQVEVFLRWEGRALHCHALVAYVVSGRSIGMGLAFTGIASGQEATLLDWISESGGSAEAGAPPAAEVLCEGEAEEARPPGLREVVADLVELLSRKQILTDSEASRYRSLLSD
jgi:hypothetical protein